MLVCVVLQNDEEGIAPLAKIWNFEKVDVHGEPQLTRTIKVSQGKKMVPVSAVAATEDLAYLAVGLYDGSVLVYGGGDFTREKFTNKSPKVVHEGESPITSLGFRSAGRDTVLFVVTSDSVWTYWMGRKQGEELDIEGGSIGCSVMSNVANGIVVGRTEVVKSYSSEGLGFALGLEGEKKMVTSFRNYLVLVGMEPKRAASSAAKKINTLTIFDTVNKYHAFNAGFNDVTHVVSEWGSLYLLTGNGQVHQLTEKDFQTKLDMLFKKNLYDMALSLAKTQSSAESNDLTIQIYKQYAHHLYQKGNYSDSMQKYIKTIGPPGDESALEPSYVIRKFLDSQRINELTAYLKALHDKDAADNHHTTLLLNCYTKLKDRKMLDEFIMGTEKQLKFDLETAISVCRQAGYFTHAVFLAKKFAQHDWYLKVQLEDEKNFQDALKYIATLPFEDAEKNLATYGKELVNELPDETTQLLSKLCTSYTPEVPADGSGALASLDAPVPVASSAAEDELFGGPRSASSSGSPKCSRPEDYIHIYVNKTSHLLRFLEHMVTVKPDCASQVYDTLLELYLQSTAETAADRKEALQHEERAMDLLRNPQAKYDDHHAMVLTQIYDFKLGILYLYEKAKQYQQIVQYYMEKDAHAEIIASCKKYGSADKTLWSQALTYFASKEHDCKAQISEVLSHIEKRNLLPPLMVIDALARNSTATLSVVKDYLIRGLLNEDQAISEDERRIRQYREETARMRAEIAELKSKAKVFQNTKCNLSNQPLEVPTVHFLCGCSFNQDVLPDDTKHCVSTDCEEERQKVEDILQRQAVEADNHEQFFKQLDGAQNRFGVVTEYFGKGLFNKLTLITDAPSGVDPTATVGAGGGVAEIDLKLDPGLLGGGSGMGGGGGGGGGYGGGGYGGGY